MITFTAENKVFHLQAKNSSYLIEIAPTGHLIHLYWGKKLPQTADYRRLLSGELRKKHLQSETANNFKLDNIPQEYPAYGNSDFRQPAFEVRLADGSSLSNLKYQSHKIASGKDKLTGLPALYVEDKKAATSLKIKLYDQKAELEVELSYTVFKEFDVIARSAVLTNKGQQKIVLERAFSAAVDFIDANYELITSAGDWSRENHLVRRSLQPGLQAVESTRGASSAQHNPFLVLARPEATEEQGEVYGFNLVYSGNFFAGVQVNSFEQARVLMGINQFDFSWQLKASESFQTPELVMTYSGKGLSKLSQTYHKLYRKHLMRGKYKEQVRPILLNNWEATYFDFDEARILEIAKAGSELGVELFVLDDGWFGSRNDDTTSLGDWFVDREKLPAGLASLAEKVNNLGLKFGLWFEPEMVSPESQLYQKHPDWCIHIPGRNRTLARSQLILDLSRPEVRAKIMEMLTTILESVKISYIKWDMNRNMTEIGSAKLDSDQQRELPHRYLLGLYEMLEELQQSFPEILFESCASGGGRFDPAMLYYMPQTWTSDNTDAGSRLKIQTGTSLFYPLVAMGAHVSAVPNHQVGRSTSLITRGDTAYFGNFGYELDLRKLTQTEKELVKKQISFYKQERTLIQTGDFYRLLRPFADQLDTAWLVVNENKTAAVAAFYKVLAEANQPGRYLKLAGLDPQKYYKVNLINQLKTELKLYPETAVYSGVELMSAGIVLPEKIVNLLPDGSESRGDFQSLVWKITAVTANT